MFAGKEEFGEDSRLELANAIAKFADLASRATDGRINFAGYAVNMIEEPMENGQIVGADPEQKAILVSFPNYVQKRDETGEADFYFSLQRAATDLLFCGLSVSYGEGMEKMTKEKNDALRIEWKVALAESCTHFSLLCFHLLNGEKGAGHDWHDLAARFFKDYADSMADTMKNDPVMSRLVDMQEEERLAEAALQSRKNTEEYVHLIEERTKATGGGETLYCLLAGILIAKATALDAVQAQERVNSPLLILEREAFRLRVKDGLRPKSLQDQRTFSVYT